MNEVEYQKSESQIIVHIKDKKVQSLNNIKKLLTILVFTVIILIIFLLKTYQFNESYDLNNDQPLEYNKKVNQNNRSISVIFLTCCQRHDMLIKTFQSFFKFNKYPIEKIIVIQDGPMNEKLQQVVQQLQKIKNITLLVTGQKGGQLRTIDQALLLVQTPYFYLSQDDWESVQPAVIQLSIQSLQKQPQMLQLWTRVHSKEFVDQTGLVDPQWTWSGLSLNPSVMRVKDIKKLKCGKFSIATDDTSYGHGAGWNENKLGHQFKQMGYYVRQTKKDYQIHLGTGRGNGFWCC